MPTVTLLPNVVRPDTIVTRSVLMSDPATRTFTATATFPADAQAALLADPTFSVVLTLQYQLALGVWHHGGTSEWQGGPGTIAPPSVTWTGMARRVRLLLDPSRVVSIGATLTYDP